MSAVAQLDDYRDADAPFRAYQRVVIDRLRADLAPRPVKPKRKGPKRLPRASKAIAWGKPHPALGEGVCASIARMSVGMPVTYRNRYTFRDVCVIVCLIIALAVAAAAGAALARGSNERSNLQNVHLQ